MEKKLFSRPFNIVCAKNYPNLYLGPGVYKKLEDAKQSNPKSWVKQKIENIEKNRIKQQFNLKKFNKFDTQRKNRILEDIQDIAKSKNPAEIDIVSSYKKNKVIDNFTGINNYYSDLKKIKITNNLKVKKIIEKTINDKDLKAEEGLYNLYKKKEDIYKLEQLFSLGLLGEKKKRVLVPTKWAITSIDDILSKKNIYNLIDFKQINDIKLFNFSFYKNRFYIIILPGSFSFEMIEHTNGMISSDFELSYPKKDYAKNVTGAYYTARLEITKYLNNIKKEGKVIVLRDIDKDYISKGVWVIRESLNKALEQKPKSFNNLEELKKYLDEIIKINPKFTFWKNQSEVLKNKTNQKRIFDFYK